MSHMLGSVQAVSEACAQPPAVNVSDGNTQMSTPTEWIILAFPLYDLILLFMNGRGQYFTLFIK